MESLEDVVGTSLDVLLVEDDDEHAFIVTKAFGKHLPRARIDRAVSGEDGLRLLDGGFYHIILLDYTLPGATGLELLQAIVERKIDAPVIMFTSSEQKELAVQALQAGAYDYVVKSADSLFYIPIIAQRAVEKHTLEREHKMLKEQLIAAREKAELHFEEMSERNVKLKETQKELSSAYDRLLEMNRMKSIFMANISHELRTPLNAIIGYTSLLLENIYGSVSDRQRDCLNRMNRRANELLHQINSILDFSKFEANRMPVYIETFDLQEVVDEVTEALRLQVADGSFDYVVEIGQIPRMRSDRQKVRQILLNLLSNAFKFTEKGEVRLCCATNNGHGTVRIEVRDTGIGIGECDLPSIFDEFRQADGSSTRRFGGTGLGLSIVKRMIEMLGGDIVVSSELDRGTCFVVNLPLELGPGAQHSPPHAVDYASQGYTGAAPNLKAAASDGTRRILSIDDDEDVIHIIEESLMPEGYEVIGAGSGREGILKATTMNPNVILLDIALPDMMGWDVLRELKQHPGTRNTPVIVMSVIDNKALGFSLGAADYLVKPVGKSKWIECVRRVERAGGQSSA